MDKILFKTKRIYYVIPDYLIVEPYSSEILQVINEGGQISTVYICSLEFFSFK